MEEKKSTQPQQQKKPFVVSPTLPINGCLWVVILSALACMAVKGCKMVNMKYDEAKVKHEMVMDSLDKVRSDTVYYKGR